MTNFLDNTKMYNKKSIESLNKKTIDTKTIDINKEKLSILQERIIFSLNMISQNSFQYEQESEATIELYTKILYGLVGIASQKGGDIEHVLEGLECQVKINKLQIK